VSRLEIERRVDELADAYSGQAFADAIKSYADGLDPVSREDLEHVLLERARAEDDAIERRFEERGWFRRVLRRIEEAERRAARPHKTDDGS
jgi:hypothetical protein